MQVSCRDISGIMLSLLWDAIGGFLGPRQCSIGLNLFYVLHHFIKGMFPLSLGHLTSQGLLGNFVLTK